jgi:hypothetical protein
MTKNQATKGGTVIVPPTPRHDVATACGGAYQLLTRLAAFSVPMPVAKSQPVLVP